MRVSRTSLAFLAVSGVLLVPGIAGLATATTAHAGPVMVAAAPTGDTGNQPGSWETYFTEEGAVGVQCYKIENPATPFVVPSAPDGRQWLAVIVKAGSGDDSNWIAQPVSAGDELSHPSGKDNSHVILCHVPLVTTPPSSTPPSSTPPSSTPPSSTPPSSTPPATSKPPTSKPPTSTPARPGFGTGEDGGFPVWTLFLGGGLAAAAAAAWPKSKGRHQQ